MKGLPLPALLNLGGTVAEPWELAEGRRASICRLPILSSSQEEGEGPPAVRPGPALLLADTFSKAFYETAVARKQLKPFALENGRKQV